MTDEEKEKMIIVFIRDYKNKKFTDEEIKEKYPLAIQYMLENFDSIYSSSNGNIAGNITEYTEGSRSIKYSDNLTLVSIIANNPILKALLGKPFLKVM